ncbi:archease [bacterium]|nr:archease [bacterium]
MKSKKQTYKYKLIDHTADFGAEVYGAEIEDVAAGSLSAIAEWWGIPPPSISENVIIATENLIEVVGGRTIDTLIEALNEWCFLVQHRYILVTEISLVWTEVSLTISWLSKDEITPPALESEIKAVTFHEGTLERFEVGIFQWYTRWIADV